MEDLLLQFDDIEVQSVNRLDDEDRQACEALQKRFEWTLSQIKRWNALFLKEQNEHPSPYFRNSYGVDRTYSREKESLNPFGKYEYSPLRGLLECSTKAGDLCAAFENKIIDHFNSRYDARLISELKLRNILFGQQVEKNGSYEFYHAANTPGQFLPLPEDAAVPTYESVTDYIFGQLGGMTFLQKRDELQLSEFGNRLRYRDITLKGRTVSLTGFVNLYTRISGEVELNYDYESAFRMVYNAIRLAFGEKENVTPGDIYKESSFGQEIALHGSAAVKTMKFFKNGKLTLSFFSNEQAQLFNDFAVTTQERFNR